MAKIYTMQRKTDQGTLETIYPVTVSSQIIRTSSKFFATSDQITKLSGIEEGANANILNKIVLNSSTEYTISDKNINITNVIPLVNGRVPASYLPEGYDDVIEGYYYTATGKFYKDASYATVMTGAAGQLYVDLSTNKVYRYGESVYVELANPQTLGYWTENSAGSITYSSGDLYRGDMGLNDSNRIAVLKTSVASLNTTNNSLATKYSDSDQSGILDKYNVLIGNVADEDKTAVVFAKQASGWTRDIPVVFNLQWTSYASAGDSTSALTKQTSKISSECAINSSGSTVILTLPKIMVSGTYDYITTNSAGQVISGAKSVLFSTDTALGTVGSLCTDGLYFDYVSTI